jgi:hypothetical protein
MPEPPADFVLPVINPRKVGPGHPPPGKGRFPGQINRITRDLKHGIVDAAAAHGADGFGAGGLTGYLLHLATHHPKAFAGLLGKLMPLQVNGTLQSVVGEVRIVSVPADTYLTAESMAKLKPAQTIDNGPQPEPEPTTPTD